MIKTLIDLNFTANIARKYTGEIGRDLMPAPMVFGLGNLEAEENSPEKRYETHIENIYNIHNITKEENTIYNLRYDMQFANNMMLKAMSNYAVIASAQKTMITDKHYQKDNKATAANELLTAGEVLVGNHSDVLYKTKALEKVKSENILLKHQLNTLVKEKLTLGFSESVDNSKTVGVFDFIPMGMIHKLPSEVAKDSFTSSATDSLISWAEKQISKNTVDKSIATQILNTLVKNSDKTTYNKEILTVDKDKASPSKEEQLNNIVSKEQIVTAKTLLQMDKEDKLQNKPQDISRRETLAIDGIEPVKIIHVNSPEEKEKVTTISPKTELLIKESKRFTAAGIMEEKILIKESQLAVDKIATETMLQADSKKLSIKGNNHIIFKKEFINTVEETARIYNGGVEVSKSSEVYNKTKVDGKSQEISSITVDRKLVENIDKATDRLIHILSTREPYKIREESIVTIAEQLERNLISIKDRNIYINKGRSLEDIFNKAAAITRGEIIYKKPKVADISTGNLTYVKPKIKDITTAKTQLKLVFKTQSPETGKILSKGVEDIATRVNSRETASGREINTAVIVARKLMDRYIRDYNKVDIKAQDKYRGKGRVIIHKEKNTPMELISDRASILTYLDNVKLVNQITPKYIKNENNQLIISEKEIHGHINRFGKKDIITIQKPINSDMYMPINIIYKKESTTDTNQQEKTVTLEVVKEIVKKEQNIFKEELKKKVAINAPANLMTQAKPVVESTITKAQIYDVADRVYNMLSDRIKSERIRGGMY